MRKNQWEYVDCDICGTKLRKHNTFIQRGLRIGKECWDDPREIKNFNLRWGTPRSNPLTTTAVEASTTYSITASGGITPSHSVESEKTRSATLGISNVPDRVFFGASYYMKIAGSGGVVDITANPQILAGNKGDILCLEGTDDTNTVTLDNGTGITLQGGVQFVIGNNDRIILVFDGSNWQEMSRHKEPEYN